MLGLGATIASGLFVVLALPPPGRDGRRGPLDRGDVARVKSQCRSTNDVEGVTGLIQDRRRVFRSILTSEGDTAVG